MFEQTPESLTHPADTSKRDAEHTDNLMIHGVPMEIDWHIDVDSPVIDKIYVEDEILDLLQNAPVVLMRIKEYLDKRMIEMERQAKLWGKQYNNV